MLRPLNGPSEDGSRCLFEEVLRELRGSNIAWLTQPETRFNSWWSTHERFPPPRAWHL